MKAARPMLAAMQKKVTRPAPVPEETIREEAAALKRIWEATEGRLPQLKFGAAFDIGNQAAVGFFLSGKSALSLKAAKGFAKGLGCLIGDFSPRLASEIAEYAKYTGIGWPFPMVDRAKWERLNPELRGYVQWATRHAVDECSANNILGAMPTRAAAPVKHEEASDEAREAARLMDALPPDRRAQLLIYLNTIRGHVALGEEVRFIVEPPAGASRAMDSQSPTAKRRQNR